MPRPFDPDNCAHVSCRIITVGDTMYQICNDCCKTVKEKPTDAPLSEWRECEI